MGPIPEWPGHKSDLNLSIYTGDYVTHPTKEANPENPMIKLITQRKVSLVLQVVPWVSRNSCTGWVPGGESQMRGYPLSLSLPEREIGVKITYGPVGGAPMSQFPEIPGNNSGSERLKRIDQSTMSICGVVKTSWNPKGAEISANPGCLAFIE